MNGPATGWDRPDENHLRLDPDGLFSKFGFNDGDVPDGFEVWRERQGLAPIDWHLDGDWHEILDELVRTRLVPAIDRDVEVVKMLTNHNPCRALTVDGRTPEEYEELLREGRVEEIEPEFVDVPYADVEQVVQRTENGLFPLAAAATETVRRLGLTSRQAGELRAIAISTGIDADVIKTCGMVLAGVRSVDPDEAAPTLVALRAAELAAEPRLVPRTYDLAHWAAIHRHLCRDTDESAGVVRPGVDVDKQLAALRDLTPESASRTLAEIVPGLVAARPFTCTALYDGGNDCARRVLIQHALERIGLTIDWKWVGPDDEAYAPADELRDRFDLAVS